MKKNKRYAMIPARAGSTRLKTKNLAFIDGIISTAVIEAAGKSLEDSGNWKAVEGLF